jgi:hypothetical protein
MDTDACYDMMQAKLVEIHNAANVNNKDAYVLAAMDFIELFNALDEWLIGGGFLPESWQR